MSKYQLFNGNLVPEDQLVMESDNRSFRYGDGFFESMRMANGRVIHLTEHWERIVRTAKFLQLSLPEDLNKNSLEEFCKDLSQRNGFINAALRLKTYRLGSGNYRPDGDLTGWNLTAQELDDSAFKLNGKGLTIGLFRDQPVSAAPLSNYKTSNSLPSVLGSLYAAKMNWDDCIMLDTNEKLVEATSSNLFLVQENTILTSDLSSGGLYGVMRKEVLRTAESLGISCVQTTLDQEDLLKADECFITNSIRGIQWVMGYGRKRYFHRVANELVKEINRKNSLS